MRIKLSIITTLLLSLFIQQTAWAATQLQASVSDNSVFLGDLFLLTITLNDTGSEYQLDTAPLEQDFKVSRPSRSSSNSYINGKSSSQTQWQITLQAKRLGELTIPALKVGSLTTKAIKISVKEPSAQATATKDNLLFMENSIDKSSVFPSQSLIFTSKLYIAQDSSELQLTTPELTDATISIYGEDKKGQTIRNGIRYETISRQFKITPNKTGTFTIHSPRLSGNTRQRVPVNEWQSRITSQPFNIRGDSLQVTIKEKPKNYQGKWLVSEDVRLFEDSTITRQNYHVGEPITRTVTLQVASMDKDKLPNIPFNYPKELRFYPDQDELKEGQANGLTYAERTVRHAVIADQAGQLTLPQIKLAWWNSETDKQEFAVLPALTLTILPAENQPETSPVETQPAPVNTKEQTTSSIVVDNQALIIWQIISALLLLALILLTFYHLAYRRAYKRNKNKSPKTVQPANLDYLHLQEALSKQQPSLTYQALLKYAQNEFPTVKSLSQLAELVNLDREDKAALSAELKTLETACTNPSTVWNPAQLSELLNKHSQQKNRQADKDIMDLNPN